MDKFQGIELLKVLGLNTEESILIRSNEDWNQHADFLRRLPRYSVRTYRSEGYGHADPHFPIISREELHENHIKLLEEGLSLIVATPIDPADAELAGCLLYDAGGILAEVALGPGTVRRVTQENKIDLRIKWTHMSDSMIDDHRIEAAMQKARSAIRALQELCPKMRVDWLVFEFSWYNQKVGQRKQELIFWELAGSREMEAEIQGLLGGKL